MKNTNKHTQKELIKQFSPFGYNQHNELEKLNKSLISYLKEKLIKKDKLQQSKILKLQKEILESNKSIEFDSSSIVNKL